MNYFYSRNGCYQLSAFAASLRHSLDSSQEVFNKFSGKLLSQFSDEWNLCSDQEKKCYLVEEHEIAHHSLLHSTPLGVLQWRINQVLHRDIEYISGELAKNQIKVPSDIGLQSWLNSERFSEACKIAGLEAEQINYYKYIISAIENSILLREILFSTRISNKNSVSIGEFLKLINKCFKYMAKRCGLSFTTEWTTNLPPETSLFPEHLSFNARDLIEVHAIAREIWILRAFGDIQGAIKRVDQVKNQLYGECFSYLEKHLKTTDLIGFAVFPMQKLVLLACSSALDLTTCQKHNELIIEQHLPWWRLENILNESDRKVSEYGFLVDSIMCLNKLCSEPVFNLESNWLRYYSFERKGPNSIDKDKDHLNFIMDANNMLSLGMDVQLHIIHQGAKANLDFLTAIISYKGKPPQPKIEEWHNRLRLSICIIEYENGVWYNDSLNFNHIMKHTDLVKDPNLKYLNYPFMSIIAVVLMSAYIGRTIGVYQSEIISDIEPIKDKLRSTFEKDINTNFSYDSEMLDSLKASVQPIIEYFLDHTYNSANVPFSGEHSIFKNHGYYY